MSALLQDTHQLPSTNLLNVLVQIEINWDDKKKVFNFESYAIEK
jgi:hypothetical protein